MEQSYWFITVMQKIKPNKQFYAEFGAQRCWGFYSNKQNALNTLHENRTDLWETVYDYAVLEEYHEGISNHTLNRQFFMYDQEKDGYFEIDEPECVKHLSSFAIG